MLIALDYGQTYNRAPALFDKFIALAVADGHEVICVTMRDQPPIMPCEVIHTCGEKKLQYMTRLGRAVDIWIDDWPATII